MPDQHHPRHEPRHPPRRHRARHRDPRRRGCLRGGGRHHEPHMRGQWTVMVSTEIRGNFVHLRGILKVPTGQLRSSLIDDLCLPYSEKFR